MPVAHGQLQILWLSVLFFVVQSCRAYYLLDSNCSVNWLISAVFSLISRQKQTPGRRHAPCSTSRLVSFVRSHQKRTHGQNDQYEIVVKMKKVCVTCIACGYFLTYPWICEKFTQLYCGLVKIKSQAKSLLEA